MHHDSVRYTTVTLAVLCLVVSSLSIAVNAYRNQPGVVSNKTSLHMIAAK